ncbi:uncharacterized membrane protein YoaK (UPF0700 family) [Bradyrhizobium japonicum]|nr:uncharacterized membrane protein YoaK (UPF0700 family) [Bradyrhizobium japonicum]MCP1786263.1 uncharacterized membrane protein YoaK (UPF0700 family) [Bradyrhizobium japonicum]MCP1808142.1 uncharacterized membrane protein YoaK (UPF0700 family) [Bradyrhizobium japonicum]MCP1817069.1 uncharacterized membrane protein YoaK (UPF0700 family) [Bradyrhizobium japonicum]MCP1871419.1 uncharacterized membrane protein YoaK (UPF0700 family) [Bradyrhizobium japonicum]
MPAAGRRLCAHAEPATARIVSMSTLDVVADAVRRDETVEIVLLLAFAGGYLDAYTWIIHGVMANAQTANLVLLWVHGGEGDWGNALRFVPPILAFAVGIVIAAWLRRLTGERAPAISTLVEILLLITIGILHNRLPDLAGTLGISLVAAMQTAVFTKVEGAVCSTVMITGNMRHAIEALFAATLGGSRIGAFRRSGILTALCMAFGLGAAVGAFATKSIPDLALGIPVVALLVVLLRCEVTPRQVSP